MADLFFTGWRKWGALLSILLALSVPAGLAVKAWHGANSNPVVKIKMTGYDPRDLLYGHYLLFQYDWNWADGEPKADACYGECCLCLGAGDTDPEAKVSTCGAAKEPGACHAVIKGQFYGGEAGNGGANPFHITQNRYYVPQTRALELEHMLREQPERLRMGLSLMPSGKAIIKDMYIDNQPVMDYLRANPPAAATP